MKWLLLLALAACGPTVIWSGHTADRAARVEVVEDGGLQFVVIDGVRHTAYKGIAGWSVAVASNHIAFAAQVGSKWVVVHDGTTSDKWDAVGALIVAPNGRLAFAAERDGGWYVVIDGIAGARYDSIAANTLAFTGDGTHIAYVGQAVKRAQVVIDGRGDPFFDGLGNLALTSDGHYAYSARDREETFVVHDGTAGKHWQRVAHITVAGSHVAYAAWDETAWRVIVDDQPQSAVDRVRRILFNSDGLHVAWVGQLGDADVLALDGVPIAGAPSLRESTVAFGPSGKLAYVTPFMLGGEHVVVDGVEGPTFDTIGTPVWSARGELAYSASRGKQPILVEGGRIHELAGRLEGDPVYSSDGARLVYVEHRPHASVVVDGGHETPFDFVFADTLAFSSDNKRWVVIAGDVRNQHLFFAIEGGHQVRLQTHELYSAALQRPEDPSALLRGWSIAEADRASGPR